MQVGDLIRVTASQMLVPHGSLAVVERVEDHEDSHGVVRLYWARMMKSDELYWFRNEWFEVLK